MARKKRNFSRIVLGDPKFHEVTITRTVNVLMRSGKKSVAENALYQALDQVGKKLSAEPIEIFYKALGNLKPAVEVRSRRVGGAAYQVPTEVRAFRSESLAIRWLVQAANSRSERKLSERLANELMDAYNNRGAAVKMREDTHKMADANKAFAHFKW